jgi:hypothetical protein
LASALHHGGSKQTKNKQTPLFIIIKIETRFSLCFPPRRHHHRLRQSSVT